MNKIILEITNILNFESFEIVSIEYVLPARMDLKIYNRKQIIITNIKHKVKRQMQYYKYYDNKIEKHVYHHKYQYEITNIPNF